MESFSIKKALDLSFPALGKSLSVVMKGLLVLSVLAGVGWSIYISYIKPHTNPTPTTSQRGTITNNYINPTADELVDIINSQVKKQEKFFIGIKLFGLKVGIAR